MCIIVGTATVQEHLIDSNSSELFSVYYVVYLYIQIVFVYVTELYRYIYARK